MKSLTIALATLICGSSVASAQVAISNSDANSRSRANANSSSNSNSNASTGNAATTVTLNQPTTSAYTPNDVTIRSAPQLYIPSVVTGNVCALGASAGVSVIGVGVGAGYSWESMSCEDRQRIALLHNMGAKNAAKEYACGADRRYYDAMKFEPSPCAVRPAWEPQPTQQPTPRPVMVAPPPPPQQIAFNAAQYPMGSDCLNAAMAAGAPLNLCAGKK